MKVSVAQLVILQGTQQHKPLHVALAYILLLSALLLLI